jgi:hypothetical protein
VHFLYHLFKYLQNNNFMFAWTEVFTDEQSARNLYHPLFCQVMENDETRNQPELVLCSLNPTQYQLDAKIATQTGNEQSYRYPFEHNRAKPGN